MRDSFMLTVQSELGWDFVLDVCWEATGQGVKLPNAIINVPCQQEKCRGGQGMSNIKSTCEACPRGMVSEPGENTCRLCGEGEGADDYAWHKYVWDDVPQCSTPSSNTICTKCEGECGTPGWRNAWNFLDGG